MTYISIICYNSYILLLFPGFSGRFGLAWVVGGAAGAVGADQDARSCRRRFRLFILRARRWCFQPAAIPFLLSPMLYNSICYFPFRFPLVFLFFICFFCISFIFLLFYPLHNIPCCFSLFSFTVFEIGGYLKHGNKSNVYIYNARAGIISQNVRAIRAMYNA